MRLFIITYLFFGVLYHDLPWLLHIEFLLLDIFTLQI